MHEAEEYLRNPENPPTLYIMYHGKKRRIFINRDDGGIGIIAPRKRKHGYFFTDWDNIEKVLYPKPKTEKSEAQINARLVRKYKKYAAQATFQSPWLRKIQAADENKSLYENGVTTGVTIEGQVISLNAIAKHNYWIAEEFRRALKERRSYQSPRFDFRGYDGSLWISVPKENDKYLQPGDIAAGFSKEYRGCANGYYYLLINDENFIGYDID